jgi:hypothetical protein
VPNPLSKFINIYSDDESQEESQRTPVRVQEEKGPEKISSPKLEVQTQEVPQKEIKDRKWPRNEEDLMHRKPE